MNCSQCGAGLRETAKICINCGAVVNIRHVPDVAKETNITLDPAPRAIDEPNAKVPSEINTTPNSEPISSQADSGSRPLFEPAPNLPPLVKKDSSTQKVAPENNGKKAYVYAGLAVAAIIAIGSLVLMLSGNKNPTASIPSQRTEPENATVSPVRLPSPDATPPAQPQIDVGNNADSRLTSDPNPQIVADANLVSKSMLNELLDLGRNKSWSAIDEKVRNAKFVSYLRGDRKSARELNKIALGMMEANDFTNAIAKLQQAVEADRGDIEIRNNLGFAYLRTGKPILAMPHFLEALMMDPTRANAWINAGEAFAEQGKVPASEAALFLAVHFSRNQTKALEMLKGDEAIIISAKFRSIIQNVQSDLPMIPQFPR